MAFPVGICYNAYTAISSPFTFGGIPMSTAYHRTNRRRADRRRRPSLLPYLLIIILAVLIISFVLHIREASQPGPNPDAGASASPSAAVSDSPSGLPSVAEAPWNLKLVNQDHPLAGDHTITTAALTNGKEVDIRIYDALLNMLNDCKAAGLDPIVCSAYRSVATQAELFEDKLDRLMEDGMSYGEAYEAASTEVAVPGTSEHSLGLAVDICALSYQILDEAQADTAEQQWLMEHCVEYGFILRYPRDKEHITGIIWEPWHYRYVGEELAREITDSGLCLEEYLALHYKLN